MSMKKLITSKINELVGKTFEEKKTTLHLISYNGMWKNNMKKKNYLVVF